MYFLRKSMFYHILKNKSEHGMSKKSPTTFFSSLGHQLKKASHFCEMSYLTAGWFGGECNVAILRVFVVGAGENRIRLEFDAGRLLGRPQPIRLRCLGIDIQIQTRVHVTHRWFVQTHDLEKVFTISNGDHFLSTLTSVFVALQKKGYYKIWTP